MGIERSVTGEKNRYNNDFCLHFDGVNKYLFADKVFDEIAINKDFTISFFLTREEKSDFSSIFDNRPLVVGTEGGIRIFVNEELGGYKINFDNGFSAPSSSPYKFTPLFNFGNLYHIALRYNSTSSILELFVNGVRKDSLDLTGRIINANNSQYSLIGATIVPIGTNPFRHKGVIRDFVVLNKFATEAEISNVYQKGVFFTNTDSNIAFNCPMDTVGVDTENMLIRSTLHVSNPDLTKVIFNFPVANGDSIKSEVIDAVGAGVVGFKTQNTSTFDSDHYILFGLNGQYGYQKNDASTGGANVFVYPVSPINAGDIIEASVNGTGTNVDLKVNNVLIHSYPVLSPIANFKPLLSARTPKIPALKNSTWNGVLITKTDILSNFESSFGDVTQLDVVNNYNYKKTVNVVKSHCVMMGYTDNEIGLNIGTSNFNAYADFYTRNLGEGFTGGGENIVYKGKEIAMQGLQFDSASGHYLDIQGLNLSKDKGYTIIIAVANKTNANWVSGQDNFFSHKGDEGINRQFLIEGQSTSSKNLRFVFPSGGGTTALISYPEQDFNNSKIQFASFVISPAKNYFLQFDRLGNKRAYGQATFNTHVDQLNAINVDFPLSFGFDEVTNAVTRIGYNGTVFLDGKLCYLAILEGLAEQEVIKRMFNNGMLRDLQDYKRLGLDLYYAPDLNNPFGDAGTIKFPNLGSGLITTIANSDLDTSWDTLLGVKSSLFRFKELF